MVPTLHCREILVCDSGLTPANKVTTNRLSLSSPGDERKEAPRAAPGSPAGAEPGRGGEPGAGRRALSVVLPAP